jgi:hypothetical protein
MRAHSRLLLAALVAISAPLLADPPPTPTRAIPEALALPTSSAAGPSTTPTEVTQTSSPTVAMPPRPSAPKPIGASEVVAVEGATKDQLYSAALSWLGSAFRSAKATIDVADAAGGHLIAKPVIPFEPAALISSNGTRGVISYSVSISVKDGRYKFEVGPFVHVGNGGAGRCDNGCNYGEITDSKTFTGKTVTGLAGSDRKNWEKLQALARAEIGPIVASLKAAMAKAASESW